MSYCLLFSLQVRPGVSSKRAMLSSCWPAGAQDQVTPTPCVWSWWPEQATGLRRNLPLHFHLYFTSALLHGPQQPAAVPPSHHLGVQSSHQAYDIESEELLWAVESLDLTIPLHSSIPFSVTSMQALRVTHLTRKLLYLFLFKKQTNKYTYA